MIEALVTAWVVVVYTVFVYRALDIGTAGALAALGTEAA